MAFADYFSKNLQSAALLLKGIDTDALKATLAKEVIGIALDGTVLKSPEGQATLDLAIRLVARLYPTIALAGLDDAASSHLRPFEDLAKAVNSKIDLRTTLDGVTQCIVLGGTRVRFGKAKRPPVLYVGSDNWFARVSTTAPVASGASSNPFGAGAAACVVVANIFRATFKTQLPMARPDTNITFSVLDMTPAGPKSANPPFKPLDLGEVHLPGIGAIGNGFVWSMARIECSGTLNLIDKETLESSNLQRYAMAFESDEGKTKVELAKGWLSKSKLKVHAKLMHWEQYVAERNDWFFDQVVVAVDNARTRINVQAALPRVVFNGWTQVGEAGVSRHGFLGSGACLACLYMPEKQTANYDELIARALHLPESREMLLDIRKRIQLRSPTERQFLDTVSTAAGVPIEELIPFEGKPLEALYLQGACGGAVMTLSKGIAGPNRTEVPMAFQSALAGILLAADLVAERTKLRARLPTKTQINLLTALPEIPSNGQLKAQNSKCFCVDPDFIATYRTKHPETPPASEIKRPAAERRAASVART